jgi:hypothetical protein
MYEFLCYNNRCHGNALKGFGLCGKIFIATCVYLTPSFLTGNLPVIRNYNFKFFVLFHLHYSKKDIPCLRTLLDKV